MSSQDYEQNKEIRGVDYNFDLLGIKDISGYDSRPLTTLDEPSNNESSNVTHQTITMTPWGNCRHKGIPDVLFKPKHE